MSDDWWRIPGPERWLLHILNNLRDGQNVIIAAPEFLPQGLYRRLSDELRREDRSIRRVEIAPDAAPAEQISAHYLPQQVAPRPTARALAAAGEFRRSIVWVEGLAPADWPGWRAFLSEYAQACKGLEPDERALFVLLLTGPPAAETLPEEVCLAVHRYDNVVDWLDMRIYASSTLERTMPPLVRQTAVDVAAELAQWDPAVVDALAGCTLEELLSPHDLLRSMAQARGWERLAAKDATWQRGVVAPCQQQQVYHSAYLALDDPQEEVSHRVWRGQLGTLLPFVEERRRKLMPRLEKHLTVPVKSWSGVKESIYELEWHEIYAQLSQKRGELDGALLETVRSLLNVRNALAHLDALSASDLCALARENGRR